MCLLQQSPFLFLPASLSESTPVMDQDQPELRETLASPAATASPPPTPVTQLAAAVMVPDASALGAPPRTWTAADDDTVLEGTSPKGGGGGGSSSVTTSEEKSAASTFAGEPATIRMNLVDLLIQRHRELHAGLKRLQSEEDSALREETLRQVTHDLAVHTSVEEIVLYPAVRKELGDIDPKKFSAGVLQMLEEHHAAKTILDELYSMDRTSERFLAKARVLMENVDHHIKEEEDNLLPDLQKHWSRERLEDLGEEFARAEKSAPTRPHPFLPDQGIFAASCQYVAAGIDKLLDATRDMMSSAAK